MQTKNINVVQPANNKIEKNAVAAAVNQNGSAVMNGMTTGNAINSNNGGINSINSTNAVNGINENTSQLQNGSLVNGAMGGALLQQSSTDSSLSTVIESTVTIPGVNGTNMTVSAMNGLNLGMKSPYQYLHLTSPNHATLAPSHQHQTNGVLPQSHQHPSTSALTQSHQHPSSSGLPHQHPTNSHASSHQHTSTSSPYQQLPISSKQHFIQTSSSVYQSVPLASSQTAVISSPYLPPPLPPRVGSSSRLGQLSHESSSALHSINSPGPVHSVYKPVPPPKPFSGLEVTTGTPSGVTTTTTSAGPSTSSAVGSNRVSIPSTVPPPVPFHQSAASVEQALREQLANVTGSTLQSCGTPPLLSHILVTDQGQFHTHSTKFPPIASEDRDHLVNAERQSRYLDGIDNPALLDDSHMPSYRSKGVGGGIPPEGTLAGALPPQSQQRPYESPFASRPPFHPSQPSAQQQQNAAAQQAKFIRESWGRNSQEQRGGIVELHPPQGHIHMNGHGPHHSSNSTHLPNGNNINGHHTYNHDQSNHINGHHSHMNGHIEHNNGAINQNKQNGLDENQVNGVQEQKNDSRKDDKWGSLTRGIASKKYQNLKERLSNRFSRSEKAEDRTNGSAYPNEKNSNSQNTNGQSVAITNGMNKPEANSQPGSSRDSFRKAIHQSNQNGNHPSNIMETNLSNQHNDGLPPQYPRSPSQYRPPQPLPPPPHSHANYQPGIPAHHNSHHHHDSVARGMAMRRSGSYHHLSQHHQDTNTPAWRSHHYSVDNLVDAQAIPSDHTYSGPTASSNRGQPAGSGGSDSGRGTANGGNEVRVSSTLDTSLDSAASQRPNAQGHSSGNDSEWVDMTDTELTRIMKKSSDNTKTGSRLTRRESLAATPPLPPLSPEGTPAASPRVSPTMRPRKHSLSHSCGGLNKPDLLEAAGQEGRQRGVGEGRTGNSSQGSSQSTPRKSSNSHTHHNHAGTKPSSSNNVGTRSIGVSNDNWSHRKQEDRRRTDTHNFHSKGNNRIDLGHTERELDAGEITSTTDALDLDSMLDGGVTEATSDDDATSAYEPDVHLIRKQLEGLEGMYSEVLKLLGGGAGGGRRGGRNMMGNNLIDSKVNRRRLHGSLSSLPSSIVSSRPGRDKRRVIDDRVRKMGSRDHGGKTIHKRFQRLESHVVTLARSVAHLSSEMRTQHLMIQEIESIRGEMASLRTGGNSGPSTGGQNSRGANQHASWESFRAGIPGLSNPGRVKKLTQFFGDEPPLVRIFLRKLGYEKYAGLFEQEKIGMLELPYLTEERLQKIGIPMGPRLRILQEAQGPIKKEGNLSVYVV